ncbi:hypothetical protein BKA60DRAFT_558004 [Fusarium oxysporum]|nr:hypothetical protein BKA60DRAFT_558004 [Fusarium oxysporum]
MAKVDRSSSRHCFCLLLALLFKQTHIHAISLPMLYNPCLTKEEKSKQNGSCNWAFISACLLLNPCSSTVRLDSSSLPGQQHGYGHVSLGTRYPCLPSQPPGTY